MSQRSLIALILAFVAPAFGQYRSYSEWRPTNEDGVRYRWTVDDLSPRACTVQLQDAYQDGNSRVRVSIVYRNHAGFHINMLMTLEIPADHRMGTERVLLGCSFVNRVAVEHVVRR